MEQIVFELNGSEKTVFEYMLFKYNGAQIAVNQYIQDKIHTYSSPHRKRISDNLTITYTELLMLIQKIAFEHKEIKVQLQDIDFIYNNSNLILQYKNNKE